MRESKSRKYIYIVYKTTNLVNKKYYVGVHRQLNLNFDNYLGSGKWFRRSVEYHGKHNFIREILFSYEYAREAYDMERIIVNEKFVKNSNTYNIKLGGKGGWDHCNIPEVRIKVEATFLKKYGSKSGALSLPEVQLKAQETKVLLYDNSCGHMHTNEVRNKIKTTRESSGINYIEKCHTPAARLKAKETRKLNGTDSCYHLRINEVISKAKDSRKLNGTDQMKQCQTKESRKKAELTRTNIYGDPHGQLRTKESKRKILLKRKITSIEKYPELNILCEVKDKDSNIIHSDIVLNLSEILYGKSRAVQKHKNISSRINSLIPFKSGKWKGYSITKLIL